MVRPRAWPLMIVALAASCRPAPPAAPAPATGAVELRMTALEGRLALLERMLAGRDAPVGSSTPLPADAAERVTEVERRLDKIVGFLRQAVQPQLDTSQVYAMPIDPLDPTLGPADAPVTLVEVFEFLCPYCSMVEPTLERLRSEYPTTLRVVSKYMVIHGQVAVAPGIAACAAGRQGKYAPFKAALWAAIWPSTGGSADRSEVEPTALEDHARTAGLDLKRYRADIADGGACASWLSTSAPMLEHFGIGGTPTVLLNGRVVEDRDYAGLKAAIDAELGRVSASGVASARYYRDVVLAKGHTAAVMISPFD